MSTYQIINPTTMLASMMGNIDVVKQMIPMYLGQGQDDFQALVDAVHKEDLVEIKAKAHHIKPTMEYLGATALRLKFQELENLSQEGADIVAIRTLFNEIEEDFGLAMQELTSYQATLV